ncbi:MAG: hypothetical protein ABMA15_30855 [Vicinamibacterales bacterium]
MNTQDGADNGKPPEWLAGEMPPGYQTRLLEIQRLSEDLKAMERFGGLLWQVGEGLTNAVRDTFVALGFDAERTPGSAAAVTVKLSDRRRLLFHVAATNEPVQKKSSELTDVFLMLNEKAEATDRVVLVTNSTPGARPSERATAVGPEALDLLQRIAVNVMTGPSLFALWQLSLDDKDRARKLVERLHEQDGGVFQMPAGLAR